MTSCKGPPPQYIPWIEQVALAWGKDECLTWPFAVRVDGYPGAVRFEGRTNCAHNIICEMAHGPAPEKRSHAAHTCGNGSVGCVNPRHLSWKTARQNCADKVAHGTAQIGEKHPRAKVSNDKVKLIRESLKSQRNIAAEFEIAQATVWAIRAHQTWSHL